MPEMMDAHLLKGETVEGLMERTSMTYRKRLQSVQRCYSSVQ